MALEQTQKYCQRCQSNELHARPATNHLLHLIITVFLCGFWLPIWILSSLKIGGWRCQKCGTSPSQTAQSILALVLVVLGGIFAYSKCSRFTGGDDYAQKAQDPPPSSEDWTTVSGEENLPPRTAPLRTFYDKKPEKASPQPTPEPAPEPAPAIPEQSEVEEQSERTDGILLTLEGLDLPADLQVLNAIQLLDPAGQEATIAADTKIEVLTRTESGTLTLRVGGNAFVGNESRLKGKVRIFDK
jgi:hypothetical protein